MDWYIDTSRPIRLYPQVGDRVYTFSSLTGTYAEFTVCNENDAFKLHDKLSFAQGAALGVPYFTSYRALFHRLGLHLYILCLIMIPICFCFKFIG